MLLAQPRRRVIAVSQKQISNIENAATNPRLDTLLGLAQGLETSLQLVPFDYVVIPRATWDELVWRDEHQLDDESLKRHTKVRSSVESLIIPDEE